jgi:hypothetical protein
MVLGADRVAARAGTAMLAATPTAVPAAQVMMVRVLSSTVVSVSGGFADALAMDERPKMRGCVRRRGTGPALAVAARAGT